MDIHGKSLFPGGPLFKGQQVLISRTQSGRLWVLTKAGGVFLLDANGKRLAGREGLLSRLVQEKDGLDEFITFPMGAEDLLVSTDKVVHLKHEEARVEAMPLMEGTNASVLGVEPEGTGAWIQSERDNTLYFVSLEKPHYLEASPVMRDAEASLVIPTGERMRGWIQTGPASFATAPLEKMSATLRLQGGTLRAGPGGSVSIDGRLDLRAALREDDAGSVELRWPIPVPADKVGGRLEVTLWDSGRAKPLVASVTRQYAPGTPPPKLNWYLDERSFGARPLQVVFLYQDALGTYARLAVSNVLFQAPLIEQVWFRTMIACILATLLFVLPLLLIPRQRPTRRWIPFLSWSVNVLGGSGLFLAGMANTWRIHFPIFVGVLFLELLLGLVMGLVSPAAFRLLASTRPFWWLVPVALGLPSTRRRIQADYVAHVGRKVEAWRRQANDERYISIPVHFREGTTQAPLAETPTLPTLLHRTLEKPEERIVRFLTSPEKGGNVLIESPGGRGKSALLREVVRRMLSDFVEDPSKPLPVLCDGRGGALDKTALQALAANPLPKDIHEVLLLRGDYVLVVDGLTESALSTDTLREFLDGGYGNSVRLLLTSRPHLGFRQVVESSSHWMVAEPRRLDDETLGRFVAAYAPERHQKAEEGLEACRGVDGTYLPILVRLALLFGHGSEGVAALYEAAFRGLLRQQGASGGEDSKLLAWAGDFCLRTYWAHGIRALRYRNAPEQEQMQKLLQAGLLVPEDAYVTPGQHPGQVRFFHDSMQSFLTARGLFTQEHDQATWDCLWRAAADPLFSTGPSERVSGADSELFQMCLQVFGPEEKLRRELRRQLLTWAVLHDADLSKRDILSAVPNDRRPRLEALIHTGTELSPRSVLGAAVSICQEDLTRLGTLYMRMAQRLWPWHQQESREEWEPEHAQPGVH
ncbi:hypothetical protein [Melittangium boletus]|uniref:hypothetical protein n=1 Tax=Melittangium boletus TaxID=83453 RepID=UPI001C54E81E|nr:hypothetical protein [Melittangium boletus]